MRQEAGRFVNWHWRAAVVLYILAAICGMSGLVWYQMQPGSQMVASPIATKSTSPQLYVFVHPLCSCSVATVSNLERLESETPGKLQITVYVVQPKYGQRWDDSSLALRLNQVKGIQTKVDVGGRMSKKMGAMTSGFAILYGPDGRKVFQGGITVARGHEGDNPGADSILAYVLTGRPLIPRTPVFGCALGDLGA